MCDTLGTVSSGGVYFAKNSDRSPNEPQLVELIGAKLCSETTLKTTYIEIEQAKETHSVLISRPAWMWGVEMGVNDCSVAIGNEAVFTKGSYGKTGLTGMDLVRLALERAESAKSALEVIISLLNRYGQGGNCGFDHDFYYDNSFLIMDKSELFVLETHDKSWVYRRSETDCISNRLCIGKDGTAYSDEACDFIKVHTDPLFTHFSGSKSRRSIVQKLSSGRHSAESLMRILRAHADDCLNPLIKPTIKSPCMHAGGLIGDHTTQSMIVDLNADLPVVWATGCSTPCISLFKPYLFGSEPVPPVFNANDPKAKNYWLKRESFHRNVLFRELPKEFYSERDEIENRWTKACESAKGDPSAMRSLSYRACKEEEAFYGAWEKKLPPQKNARAAFKAYWTKKNKALFEN